jgi:hypothetical protein
MPGGIVKLKAKNSTADKSINFGFSKCLVRLAGRGDLALTAELNSELSVLPLLLDYECLPGFLVFGGICVFFGSYEKHVYSFRRVFGLVFGASRAATAACRRSNRLGLGPVIFIGGIIGGVIIRIFIAGILGDLGVLVSKIRSDEGNTEYDKFAVHVDYTGGSVIIMRNELVEASSATFFAKNANFAL